MPEETLQRAARETEAWRELALLSLAAAVDHAVHCGEEEVTSFRDQIHQSVDQLRSETGSSQVLIAAGSLSQAVVQYNSGTQRRMDTRFQESVATMNLLVGHLEKLYPDPERQPALTAIKTSLAAAFQSSDFSAANETLPGNLAELLSLTEAKRSRNNELLSSLQDRVTILEQTPVSASSGTLVDGPSGSASFPIDPLTGLHLRSEAEAALRRAMDGNTPAYAAVFYVHRMALTNARFGAAVGNQVILLCSRHIATHLASSPGDQLFRWSGPAFVAILQRANPDIDVHAAVQHAMTAPMSRFFETPARTVYLPIKMTAEAMALQSTTYAEVADAVERFILTSSASPGSD